jgi:hypothetical protein
MLSKNLTVLKDSLPIIRAAIEKNNSDSRTGTFSNSRAQIQRINSVLVNLSEKEKAVVASIKAHPDYKGESLSPAIKPYANINQKKFFNVGERIAKEGKECDPKLGFGWVNAERIKFFTLGYNSIDQSVVYSFCPTCRGRKKFTLVSAGVLECDSCGC